MTDGESGNLPERKVEEIVKKNAPQLRPEQRERVVHEVTELVAHYQGPIPPPGFLAQFDEVVPGAADRIIKMTEGNMAHRMKMERTMVRGDLALKAMGMGCAFFALLAMLALVGLAVYLNHPWIATVLGGTTIAAVVGMFLNSHMTPTKPSPQQQPKKRRKR